ncbi:MAG: hypothetical protein A2Z14_18255 [Chloroflexi bacterium RBG_16_48_8]|nr:MAG: hypothetical protein A2Z14_18255 [Chloroflexi bacterium RBG_16_48_8]
MDKKTFFTSIMLGFFIFLAMGLCSIGVTTTLLYLFIYEPGFDYLSPALQESVLIITGSKMILPGFAWGLICTAIVHLTGESIAIKLFKNIRITSKDSIVLNGIAWVLCSIVGWFTPFIILIIEYWKVL